MRAWIDIDNPPQVQYLTPFIDAFADRGWEVLATARDNGITLELLAQRGIDVIAIGGPFGAKRRQKAFGVLSRANRLRSRVRRAGGAALLLSSSRSSALTARVLGIPAFVICDYEHVELQSYRRLGVHLLFPDVIDRETFAAKGFAPDRLIPFGGLKEDITFGRLAQDARISKRPDPRSVRVLVRPPAEDSHYFNERSRALFLAVLERLASTPAVEVIFSPRDSGQSRYLAAQNWQRPPIVLSQPRPVLDLFASVDWVVTAGGTMLREAAYLGVPAVGVFQGTLGGVDAYLASVASVALLTNLSDLDRIDWHAPITPKPIRRNPHLTQELTSALARRVTRNGSPRGRDSHR